MKSFPVRTYEDVREALLAKREIALLDVREEDPHAQCHPLFAANFSLTKIELEAWTRLPRRDVPIVLLDAGEEFADRGQGLIHCAWAGRQVAAETDSNLALDAGIEEMVVRQLRGVLMDIG